MKMKWDLFFNSLPLAVWLASAVSYLLTSYLSYREYDRNRKGNKTPSVRNAYCFLGAAWVGVTLIAWLVHYELIHHQTWFLSFVSKGGSGSGGGSDASSLGLALLGVVMTLVTAGVITISRNAVEDIRREKDLLECDIVQLEEIANKYDMEFHILLSINQLTLFRLELLYQNQQEMEAFALSSERSEEEQLRNNFRDSMQAHYAKRDGVSNYINDLHKRYNSAEHGKLMDLEYDYLNAIKRHYESFPSEREEDRNIPKRIDDILKR